MNITVQISNTRYKDRNAVVREYYTEESDFIFILWVDDFTVYQHFFIEVSHSSLSHLYNVCNMFFDFCQCENYKTTS